MPSKTQTLDVGQSHTLDSGELPSFISRQVSEARRYYFDLNPDTGAELSVVLGGWERVRADYAVYRPTFPHFCIEFVAEGHGHLTLVGEEHELVSGTVFAYGPGTPLVIYADSPHLMLKYYVTFVGARRRAIAEIGRAFQTVRRDARRPAHELRKLLI